MKVWHRNENMEPVMKKKKIIIADDNEGLLDALKEMMERAGYMVETTREGDSLLKRGNNWPDLILLDILMAGQDGREICKFLKSQKETEKIPIIIISASHQLKKSALMAGANDFVAKPFLMNDLLEKVAKQLKVEKKKKLHRNDYS